jgi:hypothetical protein
MPRGNMAAGVNADEAFAKDAYIFLSRSTTLVCLTNAPAPTWTFFARTPAQVVAELRSAGKF